MGQGVSSCPLQVFRDGQVILWLSVKAPAIRIGVAPVSRHRRNVQNIRNIIGLAYLICFACFACFTFSGLRGQVSRPLFDKIGSHIASGGALTDSDGLGFDAILAQPISKPAFV